jgi:anti-sigma factor RsiW
MVPDQQRLSVEERANLVAYLDGELPDAQSRAISTKLTQSLTARREVEALQKTWEMLDLLPLPKASEDFTARTLSVATRRPDGRIASAASEVFRKVGVGLVWTFAATALFVVGYLLTAMVWPNPSARLARDLPIAEYLDEYRDVGSFEYLEKLDSTAEFTN